MDYDNASDFEVNKAVAKALGFDVDSRYFQEGFDKKGTCLILNESSVGRELNYCNDPSDAWPIIVENNISLSHNIIMWSASSLVYGDFGDSGFNIFRSDSKASDVSSSAALRAAMIVFLKMEESK